jgi:selenocysteine lyase/cysteine desulfurase
MKQARRKFLKTLGAFSGALFAPPLLLPAQSQPLFPEFYQEVPPEKLARDEDFWALVREAFNSSPNLINLNSGGVSPQPEEVQEAVTAYTRHANEAPAYYMWRTMGRQRNNMLRKLAELAGVSAEEIAIQRNTTEAINVILQGIDWQVGDEVVTSEQDYPAMLHALKQLEARKGIRVKQVKLPVPAPDQASLIQPFVEAIGKQTRLVLVCHVINLSGQIMPVREIAQYAHQQGAEVLVDGAHSFAHLDFRIPDLGVDYFATSLHKWLYAPFGTGMLYVKKEKIAGIWPLFAAPDQQENDIRKFEHQGTRSVPVENAISHAVDFHHRLGAARKQARLQYLKQYWVEQAREIPGLQLLTNPAPEHSCAIANFAIEGKDMVALGNRLISKHNLYTTTTRHPAIRGIRISPNVFTAPRELDYLVKVLKQEAG